MVNTLAPFGFAVSHRLGAAPDYQQSKRYVAYNNPTSIAFGDPVVQLATGYIAQATAASGIQVAGIFLGCEYNSVSQKKWFSSKNWPATSDVSIGPGGATGFEVAAKICDDPLTVFKVQANGQLTLAMIGANVDFALGTASNVGISGAMIDVGTVGVQTTKPFRIIDLIRDPPGVNGSDTTSPYGYALVTFNNQDYKSLTGI